MTYPFRDAASLVRWTRMFLYAQMVMAVVAIGSGYLEYGTLSAMKDGVFESSEAAMAAAEASDARQGIVSLLQIIVMVVSGVLILRWIHRANWNARALGAHGMRFTPGWSVGWYFVPIANLWKPFQAMKDIWTASGDDRAAQPSTALVDLWWASWIIWSLAGNASGRMTMKAKGLDDLISANLVTIASDVATFPVCILLLLIIARIHRVQSERTTALSALPSVPDLAEHPAM